ncbi:hypothetical protein ACHAWT_010750 [Skeletonema menzelii]
MCVCVALAEVVLVVFEEVLACTFLIVAVVLLLLPLVLIIPEPLQAIAAGLGLEEKLLLQDVVAVVDTTGLVLSVYLDAEGDDPCSPSLLRESSSSMFSCSLSLFLFRALTMRSYIFQVA